MVFVELDLLVQCRDHVGVGRTRQQLAMARCARPVGSLRSPRNWPLRQRERRTAPHPRGQDGRHPGRDGRGSDPRAILFGSGRQRGPVLHVRGHLPGTDRRHHHVRRGVTRDVGADARCCRDRGAMGLLARSDRGRVGTPGFTEDLAKVVFPSRAGIRGPRNIWAGDASLDAARRCLGGRADAHGDGCAQASSLIQAPTLVMHYAGRPR